MRQAALQLYLQAIQLWDRFRLRRLCRAHPGVRIHPDASGNFASARFEIAPGARLTLAAGAVTERRLAGVRFSLGPDSEVIVGERTWLSSDLAPVNVVAFAGARIEIGSDCFLNGCHLSAKASVRLGDRVLVGTGSRIYDSDQHDLDADRPERTEPVRVGDCTWIASDVTVLRGVEIGAHCVVGARSLLADSLPPHTLAYGVPALPRGEVGDRSTAW